MNKTWYVFRHALATKSASGYGDQILTAGILPEAVEPIKKMAIFLNPIGPSRNFTSEILRCRQTADIITGITKKPFIPDLRLNEYYLEDFAHLSHRINKFLRETSTNNEPNIVICTHGAVIAGMKHYLLGGTFAETDLYDYPACGELVCIENKNYSIKNFNV
jgi:broad specificity phosphatase PhoE